MIRQPKPGYESRSTPTEHILDAASAVFLRQGYKKTSMDELAAAAGLSRPGLYFHFATKEQLFTASLERTIDGLRTGMRDALARIDLDLGARLFAAFEALQPKDLDFDSTARMHELVEAAVTNGPSVVEKLRVDFVRAAAAALAAERPVEREGEPTTKQLAEHLLATSDGIKSQGVTLAVYRARLRLAIQIVLQSARVIR